MVLQKVEMQCLDWINVVQDRDNLQTVVNTVLNLLVP